MIDKDLAAIKAAIAAGPTPGPWAVNGYARNSLPHIRSAKDGRYVMDAAPRGTKRSGRCRQDTDAAYIAACSPDRIARILAELERWADVVAHAVSELEELDDETAQSQANALRALLGSKE
jgi:hypothetical protein